jgi:hypothetical protein
VQNQKAFPEIIVGARLALPGEGRSKQRPYTALPKQRLKMRWQRPLLYKKANIYTRKKLEGVVEANASPLHLLLVFFCYGHPLKLPQ